MQDLVHDLVTSLLRRDEFMTVMLGEKKENISKVRRVRFQSGEGTSASLEPLTNATKLRTVIALNQKGFPCIDSLFQHTCLRVLCVINRDCFSICSLSSEPDFSNLWSTPSISNLTHLRYLDLLFTILSPKISLNQLYFLETLVLRKCSGIPKCLLNEIGSLKHLRHIDLSATDIHVIPEDIEELEKLRYFNLSSTLISKVPDSVTRITNLRTLDLYNCSRLEALPRELGSLTRLRHLHLKNSRVQVLPPSCIDKLCNLELVTLGEHCELPKEINNWTKLRIFRYDSYDNRNRMPKGVDRLTGLEKLDYIVENGSPNSGSGVDDLADLNALQDLLIVKVENVRGGKEGAETARLKDKQHLRSLRLSWLPISVEEEKEEEEKTQYRSVDDTLVLEGLQPPPGLLHMDSPVQSFQSGWLVLLYHFAFRICVR